MKRKAKTPRAVRRPSRSTLFKLATDLEQRIRDQYVLAENIRKAAEVHGNTLVGAVPMLTVLGLSLDDHLHEMGQIIGLAELLADHSSPASAKRRAAS